MRTMLGGRRLRQAVLVLLLTLLAASALALAWRAQVYDPPDSRRIALSLEHGWRFHLGDAAGAENELFDDTRWTQVQLPHTWNNRDGQDGGNDYVRGSGWYRTHLVTASSYAGRRLYLQFDGASLVTQVWLNGNAVGEHRGGFARFRFDITPYVRIGADNLLAVRVSNAPNPDVAPLGGDFTVFGGLYRGVSLLITDALQIDTLDYGGPGVYLTPTSVSPAAAQLDITTKLRNGTLASREVTLRAVLVNANQRVVAEQSTRQTIAAGAAATVVQRMELARPRLWAGRADPYLYRVYVELREGSQVVDLVEQPLGLRTVQVSRQDGFLLNGQRLALHGVAMHQDRLDQGWAIDELAIEQDVALVEQIGATAVRLAHYQHAQHTYDLFDRNGVVVWTELPLINRVGASQAFADNARQQLIELIRQNYNHPAVAFWGLANEITREEGPDPSPLLEQLAALAQHEDPSRPTVVAACCRGLDDPSNRHSDLVAFNQYFGWYNGAESDFGPWADQAFRTLPDRPIAVGEYGAGASVWQHSERPAQPDPDGWFHPEEYQRQLHEAAWGALQARPFLWGTFVWNMFDFAADARDEGDHAGRNDKGLVTYDRQIRKDAFFWYQANWSDAAVIQIAGRRNVYRTTATSDITVYANTDAVELQINGASLGIRTSSDRRFVWPDVPLQNGTNTVVATGVRAGTVYSDSVTWVRGSRLAIDVGARQPFTSQAGVFYDLDRYVQGGTARTISTAVSQTADPALLQSYRFGDFRYVIPLANGDYTVTLSMIEPYWEQPGARIFSVTAEGQPLLRDLDLFREVGRYQALERSFAVSVYDGTLDLGFTPAVDQAVVSAIVVEQKR